MSSDNNETFAVLDAPVVTPVDNYCISFNGPDGNLLMTIKADGTVDVSNLKPANETAREVLSLLSQLSKPLSDNIINDIRRADSAKE